MATNKENKKAGETLFSVDEMVEVETPKLDVAQYVGKKAKIVSAEIKTSEKYERVTYYLKLETEPVDTLKSAKTGEFELRASRIFGVFMTDDGEIAWGTESNLAKYLKSMGVKAPKDLIGKTVIVQLGEPNAQGKRFLTF